MIENQVGQENKTDDLDLIELLEKIFLFFRINRSVIIFFSVTGVIVGLVFFKMAPKLYESTLLLHTSTLTNTEQINIIENWNQLLKDGEYSILGQRLNCDSGTLKKVVKISAAEMQKSYVPNNPNAFVLTALVKDNNVLDQLNEAIVYGFENNDYIKARLLSKRSNLKELIAKVTTEISKLDSTKKYIEYSISNNSLHSSSVIIDISTINSQLIGLNEKLLAYEDELKFAHAVEVYHKFEKFEKPVSPKLFKLIVLGFIGGFAVGYTASVYNYLKKRLSVHARRIHVV